MTHLIVMLWPDKSGEEPANHVNCIFINWRDHDLTGLLMYHRHQIYLWRPRASIPNTVGREYA
jgi:hypothetical protein